MKTAQVQDRVGEAAVTENEPGEEDFSHIHDGYAKGRIKQTLCGRPYRYPKGNDLGSNSMGTHLNPVGRDDMCSKCVEIFVRDFVVRRR